jgi:ABC-type oligopeptide transport system substrate-binding subunit
MNQASGVTRIIGLIVASFLITLAAKGACAQESDTLAQEIVLSGYGPALKDTDVRKALIQAVDWTYLTENLFDDAYLPVFIYPPPPDQNAETKDQDTEILDNYSLEFDPGVALNHLGSFSKERLRLALVYEYEADIALLADGIAYDLQQLDIEVMIFETESPDELLEAEQYLKEPETGIDAILIKLVKEDPSG